MLPPMMPDIPDIVVNHKSNNAKSAYLQAYKDITHWSSPSRHNRRSAVDSDQEEEEGGDEVEGTNPVAAKGMTKRPWRAILLSGFVFLMVCVMVMTEKMMSFFSDLSRNQLFMDNLANLSRQLVSSCD